jgi:ATP/maltotriose-dependent transcriptional regulator MalT
VRTGRATETGTVLTRRELEVLQLTALGLSNEMIGKALFLSIDTIKTHLKRIGDKLGTSTRTTSVIAGITLGVIVCPCPRCREAERAASGRP